ncbi:MAG: autotransporter-associated beta strand repeat-containing protein [Limisphaerales bacterium]
MKKNQPVTWMATVLAGLFLSLPVEATVTNIVANPADYTSQPTTNVNNPIGSTTDAIGFAGGTPSWTAILMFPLPTLPPGKVIGNQTALAITLNSVGPSTTFNGDLWGVANFRTDLPTGTPNATYYYYLNNDAGPGANATPSDAKLVNNFLTPSLIGAPSGAVVTTVFGATNTLQNYIQSFYDNNPTYDASVSQAYVWLRINPDGPSGSTANRYVINAGDTGVTSALRPTLNLDIADIPTNTFVWNGDLSSVWDINTTANWKTNNLPGFTYQDGANVIFDETLSANPAVTLNATVLPSSVTVNGTTNYSISGAGKISGAASLLKLGSGTLILDTDNDYSGGTILAGGTLQVGNGGTRGSIGSGPVTNIVSGTILAFNRTDAISVNSITRNYQYNASVVVNSGSVSLEGAGDNSGTIGTVNNGGTLILAKDSSITVHALGSSSAINAGGTLKFGGTGGDQIFSGAYVTNNGTLDMAGQSEGFNGLVGNGLVTNSAVTSSTLSLGDGGGSAIFNGSIADGLGTVAVVKAGSGTQTLTGVNTYSGGTTINAGKLAVLTGGSGRDYTIANAVTFGVNVVATDGSFNANSLTAGTSKIDLQIQNSTTVAPLTVSNLVLNGTITINIASTNTFFPAQSYPLIAYTELSGSGSFVLGTLPAGVSGTLDTSSSPIRFVVATVPVTWNGNVSGAWDIDTTPNWKFGALTGLKYPDGTAVTFNDTLGGTSSLTLDTVVNPLSVTFSNNTHSYSLTGSGYISGTAMLTKTGTNLLIIDTDNDYIGGTILAGGTLQVGNGDTHGTLGFGPLTNLTGGAIIAFNRTDAISVGKITRTTVDNSARVVVNSGIVSLEGAGDNSGTIGIVNNGGTLILAKDSSPAVHALSSFAPFLVINSGGVMQMGGYGDDQIYQSSGLTDNGIFDLAGHNEGFDMLNGSGLVTSSGGSSTLQLGENNGSSTFSGTIEDGAGNVSLSKVGAGTLTLTGTNTYTGNTTVNTGKLVVATSSLGGGIYNIADAATLGVNVSAPNGSLNISSLTLGASSASALELQNLNSTSVAAINAASLTLNSTVTINISSGTFVAGQNYPLIAYSGLSGSGGFVLGALPAGVSAVLNTNASPVTLQVTAAVNPNPTNIVATFSNGTLTLQWPADHIGWLLQSNSVSLGDAGNWFTVPDSSSTNLINIPIDPNTPHVFYRLLY